MEPDVQKELETLKGMVLTWKKSFIDSATDKGGGEFLAQDFLNEIDNHVSPYVQRLYECNYLDSRQVKEFLDFCYQQVQELRDAFREEGEDA